VNLDLLNRPGQPHGALRSLRDALVRAIPLSARSLMLTHIRGCDVGLDGDRC
jgi:hypothetical protein